MTEQQLIVTGEFKDIQVEGYMLEGREENPDGQNQSS